MNVPVGILHLLKHCFSTSALRTLRCSPLDRYSHNKASVKGALLLAARLLLDIIVLEVELDVELEVAEVAALADPIMDAKVDLGATGAGAGAGRGGGGRSCL